jgi:hypothetical protein
MRASNLKPWVPGRILRHGIVLAYLALPLLVSSSQADLVDLNFSQSVPTLPPAVGGSVTLTNLGNGTSTLTTDSGIAPGSIPVSITTYLGIPLPGPSAIPVFETFVNVMSSGPAVTVGPSIEQPFSGTIRFDSNPGGTGPGNVNYLTATFVGLDLVDNLTGANGGTAATLQATQPPGTLSFSADTIPPFPPPPFFGTPLSMSISFSTLTDINGNPNPLVIVNGSLGSLTPTIMSNTGTFGSGNGVPGVPEPSTFLIAGICGLGFIGYGLLRGRILGA